MSAELVYAVTNVLLYVFWCLSVSFVCERRFSFPLSLLLHFIGGILFFLLSVQLPLFSGIRFIAGSLFFLLYAQLMHKGRRLIILLVSVSMIAAMTLSEAVYMFVMPQEAAVSGALTAEHPVLVYSGYLFVNLTADVLVVLAFRFFLRRGSYSRPDWIWLFFPILPICQIFNMNVYFAVYLGAGDIHARLGWTLLLYVLCDVILFISIRMSSNNALLRGRNEALEDQLKTQLSYYEKLTREYEDIRKMRHDIDNHLYTIQALLKEERISEAAEYSTQIIKDDRAKLRFSDCSNTVIAAYLDRKADDFEALGIPFETEILLPSDLSISNTDLICSYGNLLDNAEEACRNLDKPSIVLKTAYKAPYLTILCINTTAEETQTTGKKRRIRELQRGVGLNILSSIALKYDGEFQTQRKDGLFHASLILNGEKNAENSGL